MASYGEPMQPPSSAGSLKSPTTKSTLVGEFVGTYMLVFTVGCNVLSKTPVWAGVSIASVLMVSIYSLGKVSGGHFNPAVSFALAVSKSMNGPGIRWGHCFAYWGVQILGGICAAFSYAILFWNAFNLAPSKGFSWLSAGLCEMLYTCMLCFVVLNVAAARKYSEKKSSNEYYGLAIGFVVVAGAYGAGVVSGGCFNPAVAIGIDTSSSGMGFGWCLIYSLFELVGAFLAVVFFRLVVPKDFNPMAQNETLGARLIAEFLGTFFLVLTVGLNVIGNSPAGAFSIAASLMCMIYALADVSGANFNPAVTLALLMSGNFKGEFPDDGRSSGRQAKSATVVACLYMVVQICGAVTASFMYMFIFMGHSFPLGPMPGYAWSHVGVAEIIFTFVLCYVVLCVAAAEQTANKTMCGLAIGSCVTVGGFAIGSISGGSLNPAVSFGISISRGLSGHAVHHIEKAIAYSIFEFIGAAIAAGVLRATHIANKDLRQIPMSN